MTYNLSSSVLEAQLLWIPPHFSGCYDILVNIEKLVKKKWKILHNNNNKKNETCIESNFFL